MRDKGGMRSGDRVQMQGGSGVRDNDVACSWEGVTDGCIENQMVYGNGEGHFIG